MCERCDLTHKSISVSSDLFREGLLTITSQHVILQTVVNYTHIYLLVTSDNEVEREFMFSHVCVFVGMLETSSQLHALQPHELSST